MTTNQIFLQATDLFYKNQYEKGLQKINQCLQIHPNNPTLIANRALFYSQMGHLQKAIKQLQYCINLDYQNYIPYFNLFSLKMRRNQLQLALKDLCCSLSCLYLTRARFRKRQQDTKESIKYAKNNVQAHVLRALMLLQSKKPKQCMNQLDWAYQLNPNIPTLNKIREILQKKTGIQLRTTPDKKVPLNQQQNYRLQSSYESIQEDLMIQIKMKMAEFNGIYNDLNQQNGIVTHRVPRTLLPQEIQKLLQNNEMTEQIRQLYELKYNPTDASQPVIYQMKDEYRIQNQIEFQQKLKQEQDLDSQNDVILSNQDDDQELNNDSLMDMVDQNDQQQISKIGEDQKQQIQLEKHKQGSQLQPSQQQISEHQFQQYLVVDQYPQFPGQQASRSHIQPSYSTITQQKSNTYDNMQSSISSKDNQQITNLYPMIKNKRVYGRFKIDKLEIVNKNVIEQFFENGQEGNGDEVKDVLSSKELYCVCTYFKQKPGYKVTTCDRNLLFNFEKKILQCEWQQTFKQVQLVRQNPQSLYIKIYSKNYNSYNDDLIGTGSNIVQKNGQIVVQIQSVYTGEILGNLFVKLYLIDK